MSAAQFQRAIRKLGWNQRQAAEQLGVTEGAVSRWVSGDRQIPGPVEILIRGQVGSKPTTRKRSK